MGPIQLPTGAPGTEVEFFVAISSAAQLPAAFRRRLSAQCVDQPAHPAEAGGLDSPHFRRPDQTAGSTTADPPQQLFPANSATQLNAFADPYVFGDVVLFVTASTPSPSPATTS